MSQGNTGGRDERLILAPAAFREHYHHLRFKLKLAENRGSAFQAFFEKVSLISFFARRDTGAFRNPFEHYPRQFDWDQQVNNAFLLGLGWENASKAQELRDRQKGLRGLKKAAKAGTLPNVLGSVGQLETEKVRLEQRLDRRASQLTSFRVHPQYEEIQQQADEFQAAIRQLNMENASDLAMVTFYQESLQDERPAEPGRVAELYAEVGLALPEKVTKQLEDVRAFRQKIVANRRSFLQAEIARLNQVMSQRTEQIRHLSEKRAESMAILNSHGALEEYNNLQRLQTREQSDLEQVKQRIEALKQLDQGESKLKIEQQQLQIFATLDYEERQSARDRAIALFNSFSEALYNRPGNLIIDVGPSSPW